MEPGHEDREDFPPGTNVGVVYEPQWSPAMKTGKTSLLLGLLLVRGCRNGARP